MLQILFTQFTYFCYKKKQRKGAEWNPALGPNDIHNYYFVDLFTVLCFWTKWKPYSVYVVFVASVSQSDPLVITRNLYTVGRCRRTERWEDEYGIETESVMNAAISTTLSYTKAFWFRRMKSIIYTTVGASPRHARSGHKGVVRGVNSGEVQFDKLRKFGWDVWTGVGTFLWLILYEMRS